MLHLQASTQVYTKLYQHSSLIPIIQRFFHPIDHSSVSMSSLTPIFLCIYKKTISLVVVVTYLPYLQVSKQICKKNLFVQIFSDSRIKILHQMDRSIFPMSRSNQCCHPPWTRTFTELSMITFSSPREHPFEWCVSFITGRESGWNGGDILNYFP